MTAKKDVLVLFKTHLDIGFTDLAQNVIDKYLNTYIPNAIKVGNELKNTDTPFIWTVGSWLINEALKTDDGTLEKAIIDGIIRWHGLPCTTYTEFMSEKLFDYGISLSQKLDKRFNKTTIGAKMTDIPGHTIAMLPHLKKAGIKFIHIGVNPATPLPPVPELFKWKYKDSEIVVLYSSDYGTPIEFDDFICEYAHTGDNLGPQSADQIREIYQKMREKHPGSRIFAATIEDLAERCLKVPNLPVVTQEIGDLWIHGVGTDPKKVSQYRTLLRYIDENGIGDKDLSDNLLLIPEHTWGMDIKVAFKDSEHYTLEQLASVPEKYAKFERSWVEQREYITKAEKVLGVKAEYKPEIPALDGFEVADEKCDASLSWQIFDNADYDRYRDTYLTKRPEWAIWDNTKVGLPNYKGEIYPAIQTGCYKKGNKTVFSFEFDSTVTAVYGLPKMWITKDGEKYIVVWSGKKNSRYPQACYLKFNGLNENWLMDKMGEKISPNDVIGSPLINAVYEGIENDEVKIKSFDAPLVLPFGRHLLEYNIGETEQDMYFNLYNNIWGTNHPMWYSDDAFFRFEVIKK